MQTTIKRVKIKGICATVPDNIQKFEDDMKHFPFSEKSSLRLAKAMGFKEHRISDPQTTHCDLATYTLNYLSHKEYIDKEKVQAIIVVSSALEHPMPGNSKVIHGQAELPKSVYCMDMYENCVGFISGLYAACSMITGSDMEDVLLITTEAGACYGNIKDRSLYPLLGDAAAVTVVSKSDVPDDKISFMFGNDGSRRETMIVPAGGLRMPYSEETAKVYQDERGNFRSLNNSHIDGTEVFQFVMEEVPRLVDEICRYAGVDKKTIQYYLTTQPNKFTLEKLADLMEVPRDILFNNVAEYFGNTSSVTIPVATTHNLGEKLLHNRYKVCFSAFGAGLSLAAAVTDVGKLDFCEMIEHPGEGVINYPYRI
jgi:3-oxoacyl-[acyl-carrier-protein] synthase-3